MKIALGLTLLAFAGPASAATISFHTANTSVVFDEARSWTIGSAHRNGNALIAAAGSGQGTVISETGLGWAGSVHGNEVVHSFSISVDGISTAYSPNATYIGNSLTLTRSSTLGSVLDLTSILTVTDSGMFETVTVTRISDARIATAYGFLGSRENRLGHFASFDANQTLINLGTTIANGGAETHMTDGTVAVAQYDPTTGDGLVSIIVQGDDLGLRNFIWDRAGDNKLYARMSALHGYGTIGDTWTIQQQLRYFDASPENWHTVAASLVPEPSTALLVLPAVMLMRRRR